MLEAPSTPLMRQYQSIKQQVPQALLFFRLGDFYELFFEDAVLAARELEITLTARNKEKGQPIPMCGVPYHSSEGYIARLIQKGYRVAICEQMEAPGPGKKLVNREITRIVTPGTATSNNLLTGHQHNFLGALHQNALAFLDLSTGTFRATLLPPSVGKEELAAQIESLNIRELLLAEKQPALPALHTVLESWVFDFDYAARLLREHFRIQSFDGLFPHSQSALAGACGALLHYLRETQKASLAHLELPVFFERNDAMVLDAVTIRNLELLEPIFSSDLGGTRQSTLISVLDESSTSMGARLLRQWLLRPLLDPAAIGARHNAVAELYTLTIPRTQLRDTLASLGDMERLLSKVTMATAGPRELHALARSLAQVPKLQQHLALTQATLLGGLHSQLDPEAELTHRILHTLSAEPPANLADGGVIQDGVHPELDQLRDIQRNSKQYLAQIEIRERDRTGIASLKVRFNNVFGYYIEISKANLHLVPADYDRKQTLVNAERFITPELKDLETKILEAEERILALERELFEALRQAAAARAPQIRSTAQAIATLDVLLALAEVAVRRRYTRPGFSSSADGAPGEYKIVNGRHPVVERLVEEEAARFVPNDLYLDHEKYLAIITGPNMGGKSTYLRQAALFSILAQTGSFVPAESATLPLVDRVFTRIGAADHVARGRSTFMVEMTETALILNTATARSLIILDEIGRGTSTYDGLALAWAVVEFIHQRIGAKTLFATHYHELTALEETLPGVRNLHVAVKESGEQIIFLRKVLPGAAERSFGIEVARLAALPAVVIERAKQILALHERSEDRIAHQSSPDGAHGPLQISLFEPVNGNLAERIRQLKLDELRPIEALQILADLQKELN
ncbi:MAG: DNA mismatch repair protein MutS [Bryobacter sp.]|nr:DNA mismatch repair protein MutS [Bryobacter sp.]